MKSPWISLRIDWILKIMVQFCYVRLYLGIVTVSCHLLQRMARMEMDWDLKQLGQLFRVLMPFLQNSPPKISCFIPPDEICLITFFTTLQENQVPVGVVFTQAPYYSPHCFQQKTKNQNKTKKQAKKIYFHFVVCWVHYEGERISGPSLLLDLVPVPPGLFSSRLADRYPGNEVVPLRGNQAFQQVLLWLFHYFF